MKSSIIVILFLVALICASAQSCLECGEECKQLCGTKQFKACCFNYLKKRAAPPSGPDLKLEVSLANSAIRRGLSNGQISPYGQYLPLAAVFGRQARVVPSEQGRLQLIYDA